MDAEEGSLDAEEGSLETEEGSLEAEEGSLEAEEGSLEAELGCLQMQVSCCGGDMEGLVSYREFHRSVTVSVGVKDLDGEVAWFPQAQCHGAWV